MKGNLLFNRNKLPDAPDRTLKATALVYLEEALQSERYEECGQLVRNAQRYGASTEEIEKVITDAAKGIRRRVIRRKRTSQN